jgi:biopolymer transport protein TolR
MPVGKQDDEPLIVSVKKDGSFYLNLGKEQEQSQSLLVIQDKVGKVLKRKPETTVLVWGDEAVPYGEVVTLMTALQAAGAPSVGLVTESPKPN